MNFEARQAIGKTTNTGHRLTGELGSGTHSGVLFGQQIRTGAPVAVKIFNDSYPHDEFFAEVGVHGSLGHPNIPRLHTHGSLAIDSPVYGQLESDVLTPRRTHHNFFVMDYASGGSVAELLAANGPLPENDVLAMMHDIGDALMYAHDLGIIHRDVNTTNIVYTRIPGINERIAQLADWGAAGTPYRPNRTRTYSVGTLAHMAPEQREGRADERSDVFGLGIASYHAITGQLPSTIGPRVSFEEVLGANATSGLRAIEPVIVKMIAHDPNDRHGSVGDALEETQRTSLDATGKNERRTTIFDLGAVKATLDAHAAGLIRDADQREQSLDRREQDVSTQAARNSDTAAMLAAQEQTLDTRSQVLLAAEQTMVERENAARERIRIDRETAQAALTQREVQLDTRQQALDAQAATITASRHEVDTRMAAVTEAEAALKEQVIQEQAAREDPQQPSEHLSHPEVEIHLAHRSDEAVASPGTDIRLMGAGRGTLVLTQGADTIRLFNNGHADGEIGTLIFDWTGYRGRLRTGGNPTLARNIESVRASVKKGNKSVVRIDAPNFFPLEIQASLRTWLGTDDSKPMPLEPWKIDTTDLSRVAIDAGNDCVIVYNPGTENFIVFETEDDVMPRNWKRFDTLTAGSTDPGTEIQARIQQLQTAASVSTMRLKDSTLVPVFADTIQAGSKSDNLASIGNNVCEDPREQGTIYYCSATARTITKMNTRDGEQPEIVTLPQRYQQVRNLQIDSSGHFFTFSAQQGFIMIARDTMEEILILPDISHGVLDTQGNIHGIDPQGHLTIHTLHYVS